MTDNIQPELQTDPATIDILIENLPEQFPAAVDMIKFDIARASHRLQSRSQGSLYQDHQKANQRSIDQISIPVNR